MYPHLLTMIYADREQLGLKDALQNFSKVGSLSLESAEDLDERFAEVLETLLAETPLRQQVIIDLQGVF